MKPYHTFVGLFRGVFFYCDCMMIICFLLMINYLTLFYIITKTPYTLLNDENIMQCIQRTFTFPISLLFNDTLANANALAYKAVDLTTDGSA